MNKEFVVAGDLQAPYFFSFSVASSWFGLGEGRRIHPDSFPCLTWLSPGPIYASLRYRLRNIILLCTPANESRPPPFPLDLSDLSMAIPRATVREYLP